MRRKLRRLKKRIKHHAKKVSPKKIGITIGCIILLALIIFFISAIPSTTYDVTETDVLSLKNLQASKVSVQGVVFGDTLEAVIEKLGYPDKQQVFPPETINVEYNKRLGLEETGLIIQLKDNSVVRMTFKEPFNEFLVGKTKLSTKTDIFNTLGSPDRLNKIPVTAGSFLLMNVYTYDEQGIEVVVRKEEQNALSFFVA